VPTLPLKVVVFSGWELCAALALYSNNNTVWRHSLFDWNIGFMIRIFVCLYQPGPLSWVLPTCLKNVESRLLVLVPVFLFHIIYRRRCLDSTGTFISSYMHLFNFLRAWAYNHICTYLTSVRVLCSMLFGDISKLKQLLLPVIVEKSMSRTIVDTL